MTEQPGVRRVAEMRLRGSEGWLPLRVYWPAGAEGSGLLVDLPGGAGAAELCARTGCVVLSASGSVSADDAMVVLGWAADHASELDADPARLSVTGDLAEWAVRRALDEGWPPCDVIK